MSDLDNEELKATKKLSEKAHKATWAEDLIIYPTNKKEEKSADEMFEELSYRKHMENEIILVYRNKDYDDLCFFFNDNTIFKDKSEEFNYITMQELKAINKKCKELRVVIVNRKEDYYIPEEHPYKEFLGIIFGILFMIFCNIMTVLVIIAIIIPAL